MKNHVSGIAMSFCGSAAHTSLLKHYFMTYIGSRSLVPKILIVFIMLGVFSWAQADHQRFVFTAAALTSVDDAQERTSACYPSPFVASFELESENIADYVGYEAKGTLIEKGQVHDKATLGLEYAKGAYMQKVNKGAQQQLYRVEKQ
jgi:hypothetical protein